MLAALAGGGVGSAAGSSVGALVGMGIPEYEAKRDEGRIKSGGTLLLVHCDESEWTKKPTRFWKTAGLKTSHPQVRRRQTCRNRTGQSDRATEPFLGGCRKNSRVLPLLLSDLDEDRRESALFFQESADASIKTGSLTFVHCTTVVYRGRFWRLVCS